LTEKERKDMELFSFMWNVYKTSLEKTFQHADNMESAFALGVYETQLLNKVDGINRIFSGLITTNQEKAQLSHQLSQVKAQQFLVISIIMIIASLILSVALGYISTRSITKPLQTLLTFSYEMGKGNLSGKIGIKRNDEIGLLATAFEDMRIRLTGLINQVFTQSAHVKVLRTSLH
jgi:methyl-accepting chemotaxis protein